MSVSRRHRITRREAVPALYLIIDSTFSVACPEVPPKASLPPVTLNVGSRFQRLLISMGLLNHIEPGRIRANEPTRSIEESAISLQEWVCFAKSGSIDYPADANVIHNPLRKGRLLIQVAVVPLAINEVADKPAHS